MSYEINSQELGTCIELSTKIPNNARSLGLVTYLSFLSTNGHAIYRIFPDPHDLVLQRGISKYIENKSKREKSYVTQYFEDNSKRLSRVLKKTGFVRLQLQRQGHYERCTKSGASLGKELNIESYNLLTDSQRRFILDYIESYHIPPDRLYIDDWSEERSIKRQLGLQFC